LLQLPSLVAQKACEIHIDREETKPKTYRFWYWGTYQNTGMA
jgi:hypothetical protein